ncbi:MAG: hypothetical protein HYY50_03245 [Candidatus Kerfeldbacteria bacterium]|nr:hypothetical protein [Candidatus Kerfeldbacteria bacterium]
MKTILLTATYLVGIGELILAVFFWVTHQKQEIRKVMAFLAFFIGAWVVLNALTSYREPSHLVDLLLPWVFIASFFLITALVHVVILFPFPTIRLDGFHRILLYLPAAMLSYSFFISDDFIQGYKLTPDTTGQIIPGDLYSLYIIFFTLALLTSVGLLIQKIRRSDGVHHRHLKKLLSAILIPGVPGLIFSVFNFGFQVSYATLIAPVLSGVWLGLVTWIIIQP